MSSEIETPFTHEPLSAVEVRLLGSLIEKQATTPSPTR